MEQYTIRRTNLVFYKVNEEDKLIMVYAIVDRRREYKNLI